MNKIINSIIPVVFLSFMLFLLITFTFRFTNKTNLIGVTLAIYPKDVTFKNFVDGSFQKSFEKWLSDNFYGHNSIVKLHNQIEYSIFHDGLGDWIQGSDGYLYSKSQTYSYIGGEVVNQKTLNEYDDYAKKVYQLQTNLTNNGKDFLYLINPIKAELYPEKLPWYEKIVMDKYASKGNTIKKALIESFQKYGINYYDTTDDLKLMKKSASFDIFSKTGHHWTLTAVASEMNQLFDNIASKTPFISYPSVDVVEITDNLFGTDKDALNLLNVIWPNLSDNYTSPQIKYNNTSNNSVYIFGTSYGWEITGSLYQNQSNKAFNNLVYQEYFTNLVTYDENGSNRTSYTVNNVPADLKVMNTVKSSDLVIMEQQGNILETHEKFLNYVNENINFMEYQNGDNAITYKQDAIGVSFENFFDLENWGRWTEGQNALVHFYGDDLFNNKSNAILAMNVSSFAQNQTVKIIINGVEIAEIYVTQEKQDYSIEIPSENLSAHENIIEFKLSNKVTSPKILGQSEDARMLGLGFVKLSITGGK